MQLIKKHKWCKIWKLDGHHELEWSKIDHTDNKAWHITKTDADGFIDKRWHFSTKRDAMKFWNGV
ncbi:hypothetical protein CRP902_gp30 [Roseobacter phage CRP-902]|nr:hypothetical protein CRP902_gp30 [Roseobacter phage CRP-902]